MAANFPHGTLLALLFLYDALLREPLEEVDALRARKKPKLPLVLEKAEGRKSWIAWPASTFED